MASANGLSRPLKGRSWLTGKAAGGILHLINSGPAALDGTGQMQIDGAPAMKPFLEVTPEDAGRCLDATVWCSGDAGYFRGGGYSTRFKTAGGMPVTMSRLNIIDGLGDAEDPNNALFIAPFALDKVSPNYLFAGAADLYVENGDAALWRSLEAIWQNVTTKKIYVTGGIGASGGNEGFAEP